MNIKELRNRTNLSQRDFANEYGIPLSTLRKWEQGDATPAPYIVTLLARQIKGKADDFEVIENKKGNVFYYDKYSSTLSDSLGNVIPIKESLEGVAKSNLTIYVDDLFESFYEIQNKFNQDIRLDKEEGIIWS